MSKSKSKSTCCSKSESSCGDRTINLAKGGSTLEERRSKMLIYERKYPAPQWCGATMPIGVTTTPKSAKRIRVCTVQDMKQTCPPIMCNCPPYKPPMGLAAMIKMGIAFGIKSMIAGAVVWWTYDIGLWGDASKTEKLYQSMKASIFDTDEDEIEVTTPTSATTVYSGKQRWNSLVTKTFTFVQTIASKVAETFEGEKDCGPAKK